MNALSEPVGHYLAWTTGIVGLIAVAVLITAVMTASESSTARPSALRVAAAAADVHFAVFVAGLMLTMSYHWTPVVPR